MTTKSKTSGLFAAEKRERPAEAKAPIAMLAKKVRLSVDIDPEPYRQLISFCQDVAFSFGRSKINHVWVLREVLAELLADASLKERVIERLAESKPWER